MTILVRLSRSRFISRYRVFILRWVTLQKANDTQASQSKEKSHHKSKCLFYTSANYLTCSVCPVVSFVSFQDIAQGGKTTDDHSLVLLFWRQLQQLTQCRLDSSIILLSLVTITTINVDKLMIRLIHVSSNVYSVLEVIYKTLCDKETVVFCIAGVVK